MKRKKEGRKRGNPTGFVNPNVLKGTRTRRGRTTYPMEPHRVPPLPDLGSRGGTHGVICIIYSSNKGKLKIDKYTDIRET